MKRFLSLLFCLCILLHCFAFTSAEDADVIQLTDGLLNHPYIAMIAQNAKKDSYTLLDALPNGLYLVFDETEWGQTVADYIILGDLCLEAGDFTFRIDTPEGIKTYSLHIDVSWQILYPVNLDFCPIAESFEGKTDWQSDGFEKSSESAFDGLYSIYSNAKSDITSPRIPIEKNQYSTDLYIYDNGAVGSSYSVKASYYRSGSAELISNNTYKIECKGFWQGNRISLNYDSSADLVLEIMYEGGADLYLDQIILEPIFKPVRPFVNMLVGQKCDNTIFLFSENAEYALEGELPDGIEAERTEEGLRFTGTAKEHGVFHLDVYVRENGKCYLYDNAFYICGDIEGKGSVTTRDAVLILKYCADMINLEGAERFYANADFDSFGIVDTADAVIILKYVAGMITEF